MPCLELAVVALETTCETTTRIFFLVLSILRHMIEQCLRMVRHHLKNAHEIVVNDIAQQVRVRWIYFSRVSPLIGTLHATHGLRNDIQERDYEK